MVKDILDEAIECISNQEKTDKQEEPGYMYKFLKNCNKKKIITVTATVVLLFYLVKK